MLGCQTLLAVSRQGPSCSGNLFKAWLKGSQLRPQGHLHRLSAGSSSVLVQMEPDYGRKGQPFRVAGCYCTRTEAKLLEDRLGRSN